MKCYLAIDIGASSGRHIAGKLEGGKLKLEEVYRFSNGNSLRGGHLVWEAGRLFKEVVNGLKAAKAKNLVPDFIGIDTWAVDYALLDGEDKLIGDIYAYRDSRTEESSRRVHEIVPFEKLYQKTGIQFQKFNTIYQLYSDKLSGKLANAKSMLMLPDYLNFLLTGVKKQEYTNATSTGLVNALTHKWDEELTKQLGFPHLFGELSMPCTVVGNLKPEVQREVGFDATVILPATHDTASAVLAAPIDGEQPYISSGTWSLLGITQPFAHTDDGSRIANYSNEGSINYGFRYQKNIMGSWLIQSVRHELGDIPFGELSTLARSAKADSLIDVNDNRFLAPESMIKEIKKAVAKDLNTPELLRTIYESLAKSYADAICELERNLGKTYSSINIIGGGSRDGLLNELTAKATGKKIIAGPVEATATGNIIVQMLATGEISNFSEVGNLIKKSFEVREV